MSIKNGKDYTGKKFGRLLATQRVNAKDSPLKKTSYLCKCDCGKEKLVASVHLVTGNTKSCGCFMNDFARSRRLVDLSGQVFERLLAVERVQETGKPTKWRCKCSCGKEILALTASLKNGNTKSCGCLNLEKIIERNHDPKLILKRMKTANGCYIEKHWNTGKDLLCKGKWERNTVKWFNSLKLDFDWQIPFTLSDGRTYIVDLYDKTLDMYIEIKGWWRDDAKGKFDLFKADNPGLKVEVWGTDELKSRKILTR